MIVEYRLNCGQYVLHSKPPMGGDLVPVGRVLDELSLAIDTREGTLHKHGVPELVASWYENTTQKLRAGGCEEFADDLVVVTGRFPLEEVNRCVSNTGYAGSFYRRLLAGDIEELGWEAQEAAPAGAGARPMG